jgi:hypothetical protein
MTTPAMAQMRGVVLPGQGLVGRSQHAVLFVGPHRARQAATVDRLLGLLDEHGPKLVRKTAALLGEAEGRDVPPFCLLADLGDDLAVVVHGNAAVRIRGRGREDRLSGADAITWVERRIEPGFDSIVVGMEGDDTDPEHQRVDLRQGVVQGGGIGLISSAVRPPKAAARRAATPRKSPPAKRAPAKRAPAKTPVPIKRVSPAKRAPRGRRPSSEDFVVLMDDEPGERRPPLPPVAEAEAHAADADAEVVKGILCSRGHLNNPAARFCGVCGISLVQLTHNTVEGVRPPLGYLILDDGVTFNLDRDYVIGREPEHHPRVKSGDARALRLEDPSSTISRAHASIILVAWDVQVIDEGSANGTEVVNGEGASQQPLEPHMPETIQPGATILIGDRTLIFDAHSRV